MPAGGSDRKKRWASVVGVPIGLDTVEEEEQVEPLRLLLADETAATMLGFAAEAGSGGGGSVGQPVTGKLL